MKNRILLCKTLRAVSMMITGCLSIQMALAQDTPDYTCYCPTPAEIKVKPQKQEGVVQFEGGKFVGAIRGEKVTILSLSSASMAKYIPSRHEGVLACVYDVTNTGRFQGLENTLTLGAQVGDTPPCPEAPANTGTTATGGGMTGGSSIGSGGDTGGSGGDTGGSSSGGDTGGSGGGGDIGDGGDTGDGGDGDDTGDGSDDGN